MKSDDLLATRLPLLERFSQLPPQYDGKYLFISEQEPSSQYNSILGGFFNFSTLHIQRPQVLPAWVTFVRIYLHTVSFRHSWTHFLQMIPDDVKLDSSIFYREILRRREEFNVPFRILDFISSLDRLRGLSLQVICQHVSEFSYDFVEFLDAFLERFEAKTFHVSKAVTVFLTSVFIPTVLRGREELFIRFIRSYYRSFFAMSNAALNAFVEDVYLHIKEHIETEELPGNFNRDEVGKILDSCFFQVLCERCKESPPFLSRLFCLYKSRQEHVSTAWMRGRVSVSVSLEINGTKNFLVCCEKRNSLTLQLILGSILGSCHAAPELGFRDTGKVLRDMLQLDELRSAISEISPRFLLRRFVSLLLMRDKVQPIEVLHELAESVTTEGQERIAMDEVPTWHEIQGSPLAPIIPGLRGLFEYSVRDISQLAAWMEACGAESLWRNFCACVSGPLMQEAAMPRTNVEKIAEELNKWAGSMDHSKTDTPPRWLYVLFDMLLGYILAHYDLSREHVDICHVFVLLKQAEKNGIAEGNLVAFQDFQCRFKKQIGTWKEGRIMPALIRSLLHKEIVSKTCRALEIQENAHIILIELAKKAEESIKSLRFHRPVLDWLVGNNVESNHYSVQTLRGHCEHVLARIDSTSVIEIEALDSDVKSVLEEIGDSELVKALVHFSQNRSVIFDGLVQRCRDRYFEQRAPIAEISEGRKWIAECMGIIKKIKTGNLALSELRIVLDLVRNLNLKEEIDKICNFFADTQSVDRTKLAETLQKWLQLLQYWVNAESVVHTLEVYNLVEPTDSDFADLKQISEQSSTGDDIQISNDDAKLERLAELFKGMNHIHLQLFSTLAASENIVKFFQEFQYHSRDGRNRFDKLREMITISLRGQDFMYGLFNCVVQAHMYCEPFASKAPFLEITAAVREMKFDNPSQLDCIRTAHTHIAEVREIFNEVTSSTTENSSARMRTLKDTGKAEVHLHRLLFLPSIYQISYSVHQLANGNSDVTKTLILTQERIDEHKRQISFCLDQDANSELRDFRDQLLILDDIVEKLMQLELKGHPHYQNKELSIPLQLGIDFFREHLSKLESHERDWEDALSSARRSEPLLTIWSDSEVLMSLKLLSDVGGELVNALGLNVEPVSCARYTGGSISANAVCLASYFQALSNFVYSHRNAAHQAKENRPAYLSPERIEEVWSKRALRSGNMARFRQECADDFRIGLTALVDIVKELTAFFPATPILKSKDQFMHSLSNDDSVEKAILNIFNSPHSDCVARLPSAAQILWGSHETKSNEVDLFFQRAAIFSSHIFLVFGVNLLPFNCKELVLKYQEKLYHSSSHGELHFVYYCSPCVHIHSWIKFYPNLKTRISSSEHIGNILSQRCPKLSCIVGDIGSGKSHKIQKKLDQRSSNGVEVLSICINDTLQARDIILAFYRLLIGGKPTCVYINLSLNSPLAHANRIFFELLTLGTLRDSSQGMLLSLPDICSAWEIVVECPYGKDIGVDVKSSAALLLPAVEMLADMEQVLDADIYDVGPEERFVATYLHAYYTPGRRQDWPHLIDRVSVGNTKTEFPESEIAVREDDDLCRVLIDKAINEFAPNTSAKRTKFHQRLYLRYLYRRFKYFTGIFFSYNQDWRLNLGSTMMRQMLREADNLCCRDLSCDSRFPHVYLVFDDDHCAIPMYADEATILSQQFQKLREVTKGGLVQLSEIDRASVVSNGAPTRWERYISWALELKLEQVRESLKRFRFVLEEDNAFKLILFHERRLARLPVILEGETGVGKTFVLEMYCHLLNLKMMTPTSKLISGYFQRILSKYPEVGDVLSLVDALQNLQNERLNGRELRELWTKILARLAEASQAQLLLEFKEQILSWLSEYPLLDSEVFRQQNGKYLNGSDLSTESAEKVLKRFLGLKTKSIFHRLLVHPGVTDSTIEIFLEPILDTASDCFLRCPETTIVVFFDEVNTAGCLALFKEVMVDHSFRGKQIPPNVFFAAAINPLTDGADIQTRQKADANRPIVNRQIYFVHKLPEVMTDLVWKIKCPPNDKIKRFIMRKIELHQDDSFQNQALPFNPALRDRFADMLLAAQTFFTINYGASAVSNRDIQRTFVAISFFWNFFKVGLGESDTRPHQKQLKNRSRKKAVVSEFMLGIQRDTSQQMLENSVRLAIALVYYFRLPDSTSTDEERITTVGRQSLERLMDRFLPAMPQQGKLGFRDFVQEQLDSFVCPEHFVIPPGIALNQALKENIFAIVVCFSTRTPLGVIGAPGSSKTLSFHVIRDNLRGDHSPREFCRQFHAVDPFFYQCSDFTTSAEVESILLRALEREGQYERFGSRSRCLVFLDEAGLPDERRMELKVLHPYLDDARVAFVAISNAQFDDANRNRMLTVTRSVATLEDLVVLAKGCLGLGAQRPGELLERCVRGLCKGYLSVIEDGKSHFHYRDLIYVCRCLHRRTAEGALCSFGPTGLLRALEENMNGLSEESFRKLVEAIFSAVAAETGEDFPVPPPELFRSAIDLVRDALARPNRDSERVCPELAPRFKMVIDPSEDASAVRLLFDLGLVPPESQSPGGRGTQVFAMSDLGGDSSDVRCAELVSRIRLCMERGQTVLLVNTARIHGSLYDLLNLQFRRMTGLESGEERVYANVAIGAQTYPCPVHPNFMCVVHLPARDLPHTPAPFLSRFEKYVLGARDLAILSVQQLREAERRLVEEVLRRAVSFVAHIGQEHFYGYTASTLPSLILSRLRAPVSGAGPVDLRFVGESMFTRETELGGAGGRVAVAVRSICAQLLQLVPPEVVVVKMTSLCSGAVYCDSYFARNDHFSISGFASRLVTLEDEWASRACADSDGTGTALLCRKHVLFTRTSGAVLGLAGSRELRRRVMVVPWERARMEGQADVELRLRTFAHDDDARVLLLLVSARDCSPGLRNLFRQLIDLHEALANRAGGPAKHFVLLFHFPPHELMATACHPAVFLRGWEFHFMDLRRRDDPVDVGALARLLPAAASDMALTGECCGESPSREAEEHKEVQVDLEALGRELVWDFCLRVRVAEAISGEGGPLSDPGLCDLLPLYDLQSRPAARAAALETVLARLGVLRRLGTAFHVAGGRRYARARLVDTAEALVAGRDRLHSGFAEAVSARVRGEYAAFVNSALRRLCADYALAALQRLTHTPGAAAAAYVHEMLTMAELPEASTLPVVAPSGSQEAAVPVVRCGLKFVPRFPLFAALMHALDDAWDELATRVGAGAASRPTAERMEEAMKGGDARFASLSLIIVPEAEGERAAATSERALGSMMYSDLLDDLASHAAITFLAASGLSATLEGPAVTNMLLGDVKAAVLARLTRPDGNKLGRRSVLALACEAQSRVAAEEPLLRLLCQGLAATNALGVRVEVPAVENPSECAAAFRERLAAAVENEVRGLASGIGCGGNGDNDGASWRNRCTRWLRAFDCAVWTGGIGIGRVRIAALSTLSILLRSRSADSDASALRDLCEDVHKAIGRAGAGGSLGLVPTLLESVSARLDVPGAPGVRGKAYAEALLWNARLRLEAADDAATQIADVLRALCAPEAAAHPAAVRAALALTYASASTTVGTSATFVLRQFWAMIDGALEAAGARGAAGTAGEYVPAEFILDGERESAPISMSCPLADALFHFFLHSEDLFGASIEDLAVALGRAPAAAVEPHRRIQRAATEHCLVTALAAHFACVDTAALTDRNMDPRSRPAASALTALAGRLSASRNWSGLFCAEVARHSGEAQLLALVRAQPFARLAGRWAAEIQEQAAAHGQQVARAVEERDRQAAESLFRYRCPHCRAPFVDKVENTCDAMVCGRNAHDAPTGRVAPANIVGGYGCGQPFFFANGNPRALPFVPEAALPPPMPEDLTLVDRGLAARLAKSASPPVAMERFLDALRAARGGSSAGSARRLGVLEALVVRSAHAIPQLRLLPPIAALLVWLRRHAAHRYTREELDGGLTFEQALRDSRNSTGRHAAAAAERAFERAERAFNAYHDAVCGHMNPGACNGPTVPFPRLGRAARLCEFATLDSDGAPCLLLRVAEKLAMAQNEFFRCAAECLAGSAGCNTLRSLLNESAHSREASLEEVAETGGACLLDVGPPSELLALIRAYAAVSPSQPASGAGAAAAAAVDAAATESAADAAAEESASGLGTRVSGEGTAVEGAAAAMEDFDFAGMELTAALWFVAGRRPIETHTEGQPLVCRGDGRRRAGADVMGGLRGLVGTEELPEEAVVAAREAVGDSCGDELRRALRDLDRLAAAAIWDITAPARGGSRDGEQWDEAEQRRRAREVGGSNLADYVEAQRVAVEVAAARATLARGLRVWHLPALAAIVTARLEDLRHLFLHLPPALRHEPPAAVLAELAEVLGGALDSAADLKRAEAEVGQALDLLAEVQDALLQQADLPLRQVGRLVDREGGEGGQGRALSREVRY